MQPAVEAPTPAEPDRGPTVGDPSAARSLHHSTVVTPEGVVLEFRAAGIGSRLLAKGLDLIIRFVLLIVGLIAAAFVAAAAGDAAGVIGIVLVLFAVLYGYAALFEALWDGRTPGKRAMGIRVITVEGGPVAFRHCAIRSMLETIDLWFPVPGGLVALTSALLTKRSQRLGDLAAGTIVVREPSIRPSPVYFAPAYGAESFGLLLDASLLQAPHYALVREFLLRAGELLPEHRLALGEQLAGGVAEATGSPRPAGLDAERYLVSVLFAHQRRWAANPPPPVRSVPPGVDLASLPPPTGPAVRPAR